MEHKGQSARDSGGESNRGPAAAHGPPPCAHRVTNFCIENILRADFGRRRTEKRPEQEEEEEQEEEQEEEEEEEEKESEEERRSGGDGGAGPAGKQMLWPAWVYCTRYSDRPSAGPRSRKPKKCAAPAAAKDDKRPRTAFSAEQLQRLKTEFQKNRYLTEQRRQGLANELGLNESQIKIWFQNKRAKIKKATGNQNSLALHLMAQGLYNHSTNSSGKDRSDSD